MRLTVFCFLLISFCCPVSYAQQDTVAKKDSADLIPVQLQAIDILVRDSVNKANREQFMTDSIADLYLTLDSARENQFNTQIFKDNLSLIHPKVSQGQKQTTLQTGKPRKGRNQWVIVAIIGLFIYTALLNIFLGNDIRSVIRSFYDKYALSQMDKESGLINSWAFIGLFILFSLTFGLVLYQLTDYYNAYYEIDGFRLFITLSVIVALLFAFKFLVLKVLGFVFDINSIVTQYIAILNLTYFNVAFVLLSVALCFSLIGTQFVPLLMTITLASIAVIFMWQYLRNSVNIISNIRFHKFYLFIYLCALEICPILILIKALNI